MQIPQQTDKESCGYRMLYNINKICNKKNIEIITNEEVALEGYTLEIVKMLKGEQQNVIRREEKRGGKKIRREEHTCTDTCIDMCIDMCVGMCVGMLVDMYSRGMGRGYIVMASVGVILLRHPSGLYTYGMAQGYIVMAWVGVMQLWHPSVGVI